MKSLKLLIVPFLFCLSLNAFAQQDTFALSNLKVEYHILKVEYQKEVDLSTQLELQYKEAINALEEMNGKNTELNAYIDKQKEEIKKLKLELEKCKSKKKQ